MDNAIVSDFEARDPIYSTNHADVDWYRFEATAGEAYIVELFDVDMSLAATKGWDCNGSGYFGLGLLVYDATLTSVAFRCDPVAFRNGHNFVWFKAGASESYYIRVMSNAAINNDTGNYSLRILPQRDSVLAVWDAESFEPNDVATTAYAIDVGLDNAIVSDFEARDPIYSTNHADVDWYRFEATAGEAYIVELFDVDMSLAATKGWDCNGSGYFGLGLLVYDATLTSVAFRCDPVAFRNGHNFVWFKAGASESYFIKVMSNAATKNDTGNYSLRILPQHDSAMATWDTENLEPNDVTTTAYAIDVGLDSAITSNFEARDPIYSTNHADVDWYRFEATAGQTYLVELFDVDMSLAVTKGWDCNGAGYFGLSLVIFLGNATMTEVKRQCQPIGGDNIHNTIEFEASKESTYYIQVASNATTSTDNGNYSIRVVPKCLLQTPTQFSPSSRSWVDSIKH